MMTQRLDELEKEVGEYLKRCGRTENVFSVRIDSSALVVVDMQRFACAPRDGQEIKGLGQVVSNINALAERCREKKVPVIWLRHNFSRDSEGDDTGLYTLFHRKPLPKGMFNRGDETEIYDEMNFDPATDHVVFKNRYSAFAPGSSDLSELLKKLDVRRIWVCGVATNVCVESTARDAMQRDLETIIVSDATLSPFELIHRTALLNFRMFFGDLIETKDLLAMI